MSYIDYSLIAISTITGCVSVSVLASLVGMPIWVTSSAIALKICAITTGMKKSIINIKKKKKEHDKAKSQLNRIEILISKALVDSNMNHDEFVLINNVLK